MAETRGIATRISLILRRLVAVPVLRLFEGFWTVPLALSLVGLALFAGLQLAPEDWLRKVSFGGPPAVDAAGMRTALSVVAGGVITIASLVFSLTFVALSITAQQLSPRILDYVLRDQATQVLLGLALATFLFAASALAVGEARGTIRLALAAPVALGMAALTLGMVVIFSHRMTRVMRAEDMVARLGDQYTGALRSAHRAPEGTAPGGPEDEARLRGLLEGADEVRAASTGYLGMIDFAGLCGWAEDKGLLVEVLGAENVFVLEGQPVARVAGLHEAPEEVAGRLADHLNLSDRRLPGYDASYEAAALSEAALRALSPGINDPATAMSCANRIFQGLVLMARRDEPPRVLGTPEGEPRVLRPRRGVAEFLRETVMPIAEMAKDTASRRHLAGLTDQLRAQVSRPHEIEAVEALAEALREPAKD